MAKRHFRLIVISFNFFLLILSPASAQQFTIDTASAYLRGDTLAEVVIHADYKIPVITFSTFSNNWLFHHSKFTMGSSEMPAGASHIFPLCIPVNNSRNFKVQIDSIYLKGDDFNSQKIRLLFNIYQDGELLQTEIPVKVYQDRKIFVFVFAPGFNFPPGQSYLSFNYQFLKKGYDFYVKTNTLIKGTFYSYNKDRDEFKAAHFQNSKMVGINSSGSLTKAEYEDLISAPQIKIFCSIAW